MARKLRAITRDELNRIGVACRMLEDARDSLAGAGAKRAADYVRRALKSARGAERHAIRIVGRV